jgi:TIGR03009 family protein
MNTFYAAAKMTETSGKREATWDVSIWLLSPNMARMDMNKPPAGPGKDPVLEKMVISTGRTIYEYDGPRKVRTSAALGPGGAGNNLMLDLMSGMSPKQVTDRFSVKTAKEDENFVYLEVKPVYAADKEEFDKLTLVLCGSKFKALQYVPRMIVLDRPDGQTKETWDFPKPSVNPKGIAAETFNPVALDKGWTDDRKELPRGTSTGGGLKAPQPK